jgi:hypothetical protein
VIVTPDSIKNYGFIDEENFFICKLESKNKPLLLSKPAYKNQVGWQMNGKF